MQLLAFRAQLILRPEARIGGFEPVRGRGVTRIGGEAKKEEMRRDEWRDSGGGAEGVEGVDVVLACRYPWKFNHAASL